MQIGSISFFSSTSDTEMFHHLLGCYATGISSSLNSFFKRFAFSKFNIFEKKAVLIRLKIKTISLTKKLL